MEVGGNQIGKCPPPVIPSKIIPGQTYPWFPVEIGKLAEPWGYTGELWFADEFISIVKTEQHGGVIAMDSFSQRSIRYLTGFDVVKGYIDGAYTMVDFYCNGEIVYSTNARRYKREAIIPASVSVLYRSSVGQSDTGCVPS